MNITLELSDREIRVFEEALSLGIKSKAKVIAEWKGDMNQPALQNEIEELENLSSMLQYIRREKKRLSE